MSNGIMNLKEAANYLQMKQQTLYRLVNQGAVPGVKIGGQWKIKKEHIDQLFEHALKTEMNNLSAKSNKKV